MADFNFHHIHENISGYRLIDDFKTFENILSRRSSVLISVIKQSVIIINTDFLDSSYYNIQRIAMISKSELSKLHLDYLINDFPKHSFLLYVSLNFEKENLLYLYQTYEWFIYETAD